MKGEAVASIDWKDSAEHKVLRTMLKGAQKYVNVAKAPGLKNLRLTGFSGDPVERKVRSSMELGLLLKDPESGFSPLEERPEEPVSESQELRAGVREYTQEAFATLGLSMAAPPPPPPFPPPELLPSMCPTGRVDEGRGSGARGSTEAQKELDEAGELTWADKAKAAYKWSSYRTSPKSKGETPGYEEWDYRLGTPRSLSSRCGRCTEQHCRPTT